MEDIDVLLTDFYGKYNNEVLTEEKRNKIKSTYGTDYNTLLKDLYGKYAKEDISDEKISKIYATYGLKKKEESISPNTELVLEPKTTTTSSDLQEGVISEAELFPNDKKLTVQTPKEKKSYLSNLFTTLKGGLNDFNQMVTSIPESIYDIFALPQNAVAWATGAKIETSSKKFKDTYKIKNPMLDAYQKEGEKLNKEIESFNQENYESSSIYENIQKGNYTDALELTVSGVVRSAPVSVAMMIGGGTMKTADLMKTGTVVFLNQNKEEMDNENPDMSEMEKTIKAIGLSGAETIFESLGTAKIGSVYKDIIKKEGTEKGAKIFREGLVNAYKNAIKAYGVVSGTVGEMIEEGATQITQNMIKGKPYMEGVFDAMAIGGASGAAMTAPISVINAKNKIQKIIKEKQASKTMSNESKTKIDEIDNAIETLDKDLQQEIPDSLKETLQATKDKLEQEKNNVIESDFEKFKNLPQDQKEKLGDVEDKLDALKSEYDEIENNKNLSQESKNILKKEKADQAKKLLQEKESLLQDDVKELPSKEQIAIKEEAIKILTEEKQQQGETDFKINDEEITQKAIELSKTNPALNETETSTEKGKEQKVLPIENNQEEITLDALKNDLEGINLDDEAEVETKKVDTENTSLQELEGKINNENNNFDFTAKSGNKVVDEKGEPITVYHTTNVKNIKEFKTSGEIETLGGRVKNEGAYFTPKKGEYANKGGEEYAVQISIKNPYITTDQIESAIISPKKKAELVSKGHDGVILMRNGKAAEYIVFDKSQIKLENQTNKETQQKQEVDTKKESVSELPISNKSSEQEIFDFVNKDLENKKETSKNGNTFIRGEKDGVKYDIQQTSEGNWRVTRIIDKEGKKVYDYIDEIRNETKTQRNIVDDEKVQSRVGINDNKSKDNKVQSAFDNRTGQGEVEVKEGNNTYSIKKESGVLVVKNEKGQSPSKVTERKILRKYAEDFDFTNGETYQIPKGATETDILNIDNEIANNSNNPAELAEVALRTKTNEFINENADTDAIQIIEYIQGNVKRGKKGDKGNDGSYVNESDSNNITNAIAKTYLKSDGRGLDVLAQELSNDMGKEITIQDIIDVIEMYPNGINDVKKEVRDLYSNPAKKRFSELTGLPSTDWYLQKAIEQAIAKEKLNQELYNNYLLTLTDAEMQLLNQEKTDYEKTTYQGSESGNEFANTKDSKKESRVREIIDTKDGGKEQIPESINLDSKTLINTDNIDAVYNYFDQIDKYLSDYGKNNLSSVIIPIPVLQAAIKAMKLAVKTAKVGADIINAGYKAIIESDWYKNQNNQEEIKTTINDFLKNPTAELFDAISNKEKNKSDKRAEKLKATTQRLRNQRNNLIDYKKALIDDIYDRLKLESLDRLNNSFKKGIFKKINGAKTIEAVDKLADEIDNRIATEVKKAIDAKIDKILREPKTFLKSINGKPKANKVDNDTRKIFNSIIGYFNYSIPELEKIKSTYESNYSQSNLDSDIDNVIAVESVLQLKQADELLSINEQEKQDRADAISKRRIDKTIQIPKINKALQTQRILKSIELKENAFNDFDAFLNEGKFKLKELVKAEAERLKNIIEFSVDETNHRFNKPTKDTKTAVEYQEYTTNRFVKFLSKIKNLKEKIVNPALLTFEYVFGYIDHKNNHGEGKMYNHFYKNGVIESEGNHSKDRAEIQKEIADKLTEIFKKRIGDNFFTKGYKKHKFQKEVVEKKLNTGIRKLENGERSSQDFPMSYDNALAIYQMSKMEENLDALELQGFDTVALQQLKDFLGTDFVAWGDFMTDFLKSKHAKYNEVYKAILRTDLPFTENYFPTKRDKSEIKVEINVGDAQFSLPGVGNGHLKSKVNSTIKLDEGASAFNMFQEYINSMENFHHYARLSKDLNAILSNKEFKNNVEKYDKNAYDSLISVSHKVLGSKQQTKIEKNTNLSWIYTINSGISVGYIAYRFFTAFKQLGSLPAYLEQADNFKIKYDGKDYFIPLVGGTLFLGKMGGKLLNPIAWRNNMKFFRENSNSYAERLRQGSIGDEFVLNLLNSNNDKLANKVIKKYVRIGMKPNQAIDALTIAIGGKVYYDQQYKKYIKIMPKTEAHQKAVRDFDVLYRTTQQSASKSELSELQLNKGGIASFITVFKNSQFGYMRRIFASGNNITKRYKRGKEKYLKQGFSESKATWKAYSELKNIETYNDVSNMVLFATVLPVVWAIISKIPKILTEGWDDEEDDKEVLRSAVLGGLEGFPLINDISVFAYNKAVLEKNWKFESAIWIKEMQDMLTDVQKVHDEYDIFSKEILFVYATELLKWKGVNFDTQKNIYDGLEELFLDNDADGFDIQSIMKIMNAPKVSREKKENKKEEKKPVAIPWSTR